MESLRDIAKRYEVNMEQEKSGSFKVKDGQNKIRICSILHPYKSSYKGTPTLKFVCWVIDRSDGEIKPYFAPYTVFKALVAYQEEEDYTWTDFPMPRDVSINAKNAGTKEVEYTVICGAKEFPLTEKEEEALEKKGSIEEFIDKLKEKQAAKVEEEIEDEPSGLDTIPFD
jgi:hypothetical protein